MTAPPAVKKSNRKLVLLLFGLAVGMVGFSFALVPLYGLFCNAVGANRLEVAQFDPQAVTPGSGNAGTGRYVTVEFDANVNSNLPWDFEPVQRSVRAAVGVPTLVKYRVHNRSDKPIVAQAIPAITPWQVTGFLSKIECFCFSRQELEPGETKEMPLRFVVSPDLPPEYGALVLSYTFLNTDKQTAPPMKNISALTVRQ